MGNEAQTTGAGNPTAAAPDLEKLQRDAATVERTRITEIREAVQSARLEDSIAEDFIARGVSADEVRRDVLRRMAEQSDAQGVTSRADIKPSATNRNPPRNGCRCPASPFSIPKNSLPEGAREFRGLTLIEAARDCLERQGIKTGAWTSWRFPAAPFEGNSDLANIVANVANKTLRQAYQSAPAPSPPGPAKPAPPTSSPSPASPSPMRRSSETVNENGEFKRGAVTDGKKPTSLPPSARSSALPVRLSSTTTSLPSPACRGSSPPLLPTTSRTRSMASSPPTPPWPMASRFPRHPCQPDRHWDRHLRRQPGRRPRRNACPEDPAGRGHEPGAALPDRAGGQGNPGQPIHQRRFRLRQGQRHQPLQGWTGGHRRRPAGC